MNSYRAIAFFVICTIGFVLSLPIYFYRFFVVHCFAPLFRDKIGKPVAPMSTLFTTDLCQISCKSNHNISKSSLVCSLVFEGHIPVSDLKKSIKRKWIDKVDQEAENGKFVRHAQALPFYPEFQSYVESWMGFLFWKWDNKFNLDNHIKSHTLSSNVPEKECEKFVRDLKEKLQNKPFAPKRSPWEVCIVDNYRSTEFKCNTATVLIFRINHCLADGHSIMTLLIEDLLEEKMELVNVAKPAARQGQGNIFTMERIKQTAVEFKKYLGVLLSEDDGDPEMLWTPFHVKPKMKDVSKVVYAGSPPISIQKLKDISKNAGVPFSSVLVSCVSGGLARHLKENRTKHERMKNYYVTCGFVLPRPGHPKTLANHFTVGNLDISLNAGLNALERLEESDQLLNNLRNSLFPLLLPVELMFLGSHLTPFVKYLMVNRLHPVGLSSFPGPGVPISYNGRKALSMDFQIGLIQGVGGLGIMILSYNGQIRINALAESCTMGREQLDDLICYICEEIDKLYEICLNRQINCVT